MNDPSRSSTLSSPVSTGSTSNFSARGYFVVLLLTLLLLELPVLTVERVPLLDLPNHIARDYILYNYQAVPQFAERFRIDYSPLPNLAMDAIMVPLQALVNAFVAAKIFVALVILVFLISCHVLARTIRGRNTYTALFCASFVYSATFLFGFLNYLLGVSIYFLVFALYWRWRDNYTPWRVVALALLVVASFLCHLTSFGFLAVSITLTAAWDFIEKRSLRNLLLSAFTLAPAVILAVLHLLKYRSGTETRIAYEGLRGKVGVAASLIRTFDLKFDLVVALILLLAIAIVLLTGKNWRIHWRFLALGGVFAFMALVSPFEVATSQYFDLRFVLPAWVIGILAIEMELQRRQALIVLVLLAMFVLLRTGGIWREWRSMDREASAIVQSFSKLEPGCRIAVRQFIPQDVESRRVRFLYTHLIQYATVTRNCTPENLLALPGQQPVLWREWKPTYVDRPARGKPLPMPDDYDYVVTYMAPDWFLDHMESSSTPIYSDGAYVLWSFRREDRK